MSLDACIAALAARQDSVFKLAQARAIGLGDAALAHRVAAGRLVRVHREVYAIGGVPLSWSGRVRAAALASNATVSHVGCAATYGALPPPEGPIDVTKPAGSRRGPSGVRVHVAELKVTERADRRGIPLTSAVRLMLDLAATQPPAVVERAYNECQVLKLLTPQQVLDALPGWAGRRGVGALREIVGADGAGVTRTRMEDIFRGIVRSARVPGYEANQWVEGVFVDAVWRRQRVVVELDSRTFHGTDRRFETDRSKGNHLLLKGWIPLRFTYRRLTREPLVVVAEVVTALEQGERRAA